ncbi:MAG: glycosyltransferase family 2 protein [Clostridiales bacterium]|nr:glycosyltransferase family 2 protein [Clostridiales bacterium]
MQIATIVIPNLDGARFLGPCLDSLMRQTRQDFSVILIDNASQDESVELVRTRYPQVTVFRFDTNRGFCAAVNEGIRQSRTPYVILLNNDTVCEETFVEELVRAIETPPRSASAAERSRGLKNAARCTAAIEVLSAPHVFSCAAKMVQMSAPERMDNAGDYYCALGWAYAYGKGKPAADYDREREIFSSCAAAAIYRREVFDEIGLFDETHFAYLEDTDIGYRARIAGYRNYYAPKAVVRHVGSATSGSVYNAFKTRYSARNNIYLIYKNMPWAQLLLNLPFLLPGFLIKLLFFAAKGFFREYAAGILEGVSLCRREKKARFRWKNCRAYVRIQLSLWGNLFRRLADI